MLILKAWKRKETVEEIIDGRVDDEIIKAMKSEEATVKMAALFFCWNKFDRHYISLSVFILYHFAGRHGRGC
jgi:hypothetical protein